MPSPPSHPAHVVEIRARTGWVPLNLREIGEFRELLGFFLWRDLKSRYRQMALGPLWIILQPLINTALFTLLFSRLANVPSDGIPYPVFAYSALLLWGFFSSCAETSSVSLLAFKNLIAKVYFPRLIVPLVGILSALIEFGISLLLLFAMMAWFGMAPGPALLGLPLLLLPAAGLGLAIGVWTAPWVVHFRDVSQIVGLGLRAGMYISPVVYPASLVPAGWRGVYDLNPVTPLINAWRGMLFGQPVDWLSLAYPALLALPLLAAGAYVFRRAERNIVDVT